MADGNGSLIQWNVVNWITIVLMVAIAFYFSGAIVALVKGGLPKTSDA